MFDKSEVIIAIGALVSVVSILAGAITILWRQNNKYAAKDKQELEDCRNNYDNIMHKVVDLSAELGEVKGGIGAMEKLCKETLVEVARNSNSNV